MLQLFSRLGAWWAKSKSRAVWSNPDSYKEWWGSRAAIAAGFVARDSTVLDVGCGRMQLRDHLPAGCAYVPADMTKWSDDVHQVDLDKGEFPPGHYDYVMMLGVLEYLRDPPSALSAARAASSNLATSYCHPGASSRKRKRRQNLWINDYSPDEFRPMLEQAGWYLTEEVEYSHGSRVVQVVYYCRGENVAGKPAGVGGTEMPALSLASEEVSERVQALVPQEAAASVASVDGGR